MKKSLLLFILALSLNICISQQRAFIPSELKDYAVKSDYIRPFAVNPDLQVYKGPNSYTSVLQDGTIITEDNIGKTVYDLQTNGSLQNRIHCYDDGTIGAVWTMGLQATTFPDRGTGYNYFDGTNWGTEPTVRIETFRAGWPSYAPWGPNGEITVSHDFANFELYFQTRPQKGTGSWTQTLFEYSNGPTTLAWPRMTTSSDDHNTIQLLASTYGEYNGQTLGVVYSRSQDGGATWDIENATLDGTGIDFYLEIAADQYVWANPVGNTVAFLVASAWHDLFMMKSSDNGDTWEKTVIWEHPYPFFDFEVTVTDTFFCVDNSASIALDSEGKAHVAFGINRVIHAAVGTTFNYFPYIDGIGYWNEDMETFSNDLNALAPPQYGYPNSELVEDYNYIGWTQDIDDDGEITYVETPTGFPMAYRELGISTMPSISIGPDNWIVVTFSSTTETYNNTDWNFKKLWMRDKPGGANWGSFVHLTEDIFHIFDESIYAVTNPTWDEYIYVLYNNDGAPGTGLDEDHEYIENTLSCMKIQLEGVGVKENQPPRQEQETMIVSPNPSDGFIQVSYSVGQDSYVELSIRDVTGKEVYHSAPGWKPKGDYLFYQDVSGLNAGVYFISIETARGRIVRKLILQ
jgi:hypothetical protein